MTRRLTVAQATIEFLKNQYVERDGKQHAFFGGCFGIFGHGNMAGIGQALHQDPEFPYYLCRNEQAMVHTAVAYAKMSNRLRSLVCTTSIGPGATNMVTGAAGATINRMPVLLLAGDIFARRNVAPVLQQLESPSSQDISVNDCFKPITRYWDRIYRPEQIITSLPEVMRVLTSQADTGAVMLAMPQDVQTEAFDYPEALFEKRVWVIRRPRPDAGVSQRAAEWIQGAKKPIIIAGGGVLYSEATDALSRFAAQTGIQVAETMAGKGSLCYDHGQCSGAFGFYGTPGANILGREADLVIGIGTRYSDFTTMSKTAFQNPDVRFININITEFDAYKHSALPVVADAKVALEEISKAVGGYRISDEYRQRMDRFRTDWDQEVDRFYNLQHGPPISQPEVIGAVNRLIQPKDVMVAAAGSLPGDMVKLWRARDPKGFHIEYGYSTMGYEIAGGLGVKMADREREVYVLVGDGSYLMMAQELVSSLAEGHKLNIVVVDNHGFGSIGALSDAVVGGKFGTEYRYRKNGQLGGDLIGIDFVANAQSMRAHAVRARTLGELEEAIKGMAQQDRTNVVVIETARKGVGNFESWWDVPIAEVSEVNAVRAAREKYETARKKERYFL